jgi:hypothetical protein
MKRLQVCALLLCGVGCDDDTTKCDAPACEDSSDDGGTSQPRQDASASGGLGAGATQYTEASEASNSAKTTPESLNYTLESTNGIAIRGTFESSNPTADSYRFNSGRLGGATGTPGFPGIDALLVIDGDRTQRNTPLLLSLDTFVEKGYSAVSGGNYFANAALITGLDYVITVAAGPAGKSYVLELRGKTP